MTDMNKTSNLLQVDNGKNESIVLNSKIADSSSKIIFDDPVLCSQFLRDYIDIPCLKDVRPEDIEDVSEQYVPLFSEERNADRVKKVRIKNENSFFLISLIEHKSKVDYDVCMQIFRYMVFIWEAFAKEAEKIHKRISKQAGFKYPPILPIVYYEGSEKWTVPSDFKSRIMEGDTFGKFIPDFEYYMVPLHNYSNEELLEKKDEISLVMLINRMQSAAEIEEFRKLPVHKVEEILKDTPEHILDIIGNILRVFLLKMNLPEEETEELVGKVKDKKMGYLFENMEKIDIQEERRKFAAEREKLQQEKEEMRQEKEEMRQEKEEMRQEIAEIQQDAEVQKKRADAAEMKVVKTAVETYQEMGASKEETKQKLQVKFNLTESQATEKIALYWKE